MMKRNANAPIALFVYNRLSHLEETIRALSSNRLAADSELIVFSDGSVDQNDKEMVDRVRRRVAGIEGFKNVRVVERERNFGLAASIIDGVSEVVARYGRVIVLEDDMVTSPWFLEYMNQALDLYADEEKVISIHGYCYPIAGLPDTFFLKGADCWGWATWRRGWDLFEKDGERLLGILQVRNLMDRFDFFGAHRYSRMLKRQIRGENDSWAIRWYASALANDRLTLYPGRSLVKNIGVDGSGRHCLATDHYYCEPADSLPSLGGIAIEENPLALEAFGEFFRQGKGRLFGLADKIKRWWRGVV